MAKLKKVVLASGNAGKLREFSQLIEPLGIELIPQSSLGISEAAEPYLTFVENALAKARHASRASGLPALADDSGICVHALNGEPGVHSARYAEDEHGNRSDHANNQKVIDALSALDCAEGSVDRGAHYVAVLVLVRHADDPQPLIAEANWSGVFVDQPQGEHGFGYDPHFWLVDQQMTVAQLPPDLKNLLSHRGQAFRELIRKLSSPEFS